jgi:AAA15 family ATPase/GTPase
MITELEIQNFRGLRDVKLTGLKSINLIVGGNDTGKTSILEALVLLLGGAAHDWDEFRTIKPRPDDYNRRAIAGRRARA